MSPIGTQRGQDYVSVIPGVSDECGQALNASRANSTIKLS
jgi:hypothetical protein